jgi:hypothetical protein
VSGARRPARLPGTVASLLSLPWSVAALVIANLVPLVGVLIAGWSLPTILVLYWVENGVVGVLNVPKILLARGTGGGTPSPGTFTMAMPPALTGGASRAALASFFVLHYGVFWVVHGVFVFALPSFIGPTSIPNGGFGMFGSGSVALGAIPPAAALLFGSHLVSFWQNELVRREYLRISPVQQMMAPYGRVVVMHMTILGGAFLALLLNAPLWSLVVMVVLKIGLDLRAHAVEHARASSGPVAPAQS